jgi:hypothetical protein
MFKSRHQPTGQYRCLNVANKSLEKCGKVEILGSNGNKPELHSEGNKEQTEFGRRPGPPGWGLGAGLTIQPCKKVIVTKPPKGRPRPALGCMIMMMMMMKMN